MFKIRHRGRSRGRAAETLAPGTQLSTETVWHRRGPWRRHGLWYQLEISFIQDHLATVAANHSHASSLFESLDFSQYRIPLVLPSLHVGFMGGAQFGGFPGTPGFEGPGFALVTNIGHLITDRFLTPLMLSAQLGHAARRLGRLLVRGSMLALTVGELVRHLANDQAHANKPPETIAIEGE